MIRWLTVPLWAAMLALPGVACFGPLRVDECGAFAEGADSCDACVDGACCAEGRACRESPACAALFDCLGACGDDAACRAACAEAHPSDEAAAAFSACRTNLCGDTCFTCGGYYEIESPTCDDCTRRACCTSAVECFANEACRARLACDNDCEIPGCHDTCRRLYPSPPGYDTLVQCVSRSCYNQCDVGHHYDCAGEFQWPKATKSTVTYSGFFFDEYGTYPEQRPLPGLTVRACLDFECASPRGEGVTGEDGRVSFDVEVGPEGFQGNFQITGRDDYVPLIRWRTTPLLDDWDSGYDLFSREELDDGAVALGIPLGTIDTTGLVLAFPADCDGTWSAGVALAMVDPPPGVVQFYFAPQGPPTVNADETLDIGQDDPEGGGWALVPPGFRTLQASYEGEVYSTIIVEARAGWISSASLAPTP